MRSATTGRTWSATFWDMQADLKKFSVPLLIVAGDEDESCLDGSVFLKRIAPTAGLYVIPRSGHDIPTEEPAAFNAALSDLFAAARVRPLARASQAGVNSDSAVLPWSCWPAIIRANG
jgi:pimeloyl-ACP methyl ester carboxylesterase